MQLCKEIHTSIKLTSIPCEIHGPEFFSIITKNTLKTKN